MAVKDNKETPLMKQYYAMKAKYPDALMLFRMGDFYETFGEDAIKTAKILGITLTHRNSGNPGSSELAGFPHHAIDTYLPKLVRAGLRVAVCEQLEDPKKTKTLVKRGVIELVTPGACYGDYATDTRSNSFLAAVYYKKSEISMALLDLATGEFLTTEGSENEIVQLINGFSPKEIIYPRGSEERFESLFGTKYYKYPIEEWFFDSDSGRARLIKQFGVQSLKGYGIETMEMSISAAGAIMAYLEMTKHDTIAHITGISKIDQSEHLLIDKFTLRNLEIIHPTFEGGRSLATTIDKCETPMGARMLRRWLAMPLKSPEAINKRLDIVTALFNDEELIDSLGNNLREVGDLERLVAKIGVGRVSPREMNQLKTSLATIPSIIELCSGANDSLSLFTQQLNPCIDLVTTIESTLNPDAPALLSKGNVIATGVSEELDELRQLSLHGKDMLQQMQQREIEATGIPTLKIGFNNVFGYYIEVSKSYRDKTPESWIRKQTLVNGERFITPELKVYEEKIMGAEERIAELESEIYSTLLAEAGAYIKQIQVDAHALATLDVLYSFAKSSKQYNYTKPIVDNSDKIDIKDGRHPVIERILPAGEEYIANDLLLNQSDQQIIIITGPNMAGKSAFLRQTALIAIMAQCGCYVPAKSAHIGYLDKIFTRVGASDNISQGESTFMVEMNEAAYILNNISDRSLVLFDELGRGTSTYDGISIAWAIVESIHENPKHRAKTLFATHYHELNEMERSFKKIRNFNVSVKELENRVIFLRKLIPGGSEHSFGIQVGKMAGLPVSVTRRATEILKQLESHTAHNSIAEGEPTEKDMKSVADNREGLQLSFFQLDDPTLRQIRDEIINLDINNLTPVEALNKLNEIKKILG